LNILERTLNAINHEEVYPVPVVLWDLAPWMPSMFNVNIKEYYQNFDLLTPNEVEAENFTGTSSLEKMGQKIMKRLNPQALVITRGGRGMLLFKDKGEVNNIPPAGFTPVADVSGAGDTVISALMLGRLGGATWVEGAYLASYAAAVVVRKSGTAVASPEEVLSFAPGKEDDQGVN